MGEGIGFGKTILFGDHFVVYGLPGIAAGLNNSTTAKIEPSDKFEFEDNRPQTPGYKEKKKSEIQRQLDSLIEQFDLNIEKTPLKITLSGNLVCASGMGASAALAASIARALSKEFGKELDDEQINKIAYLAEEAGSGTPSGIDNTCAVYGGFITFEKNLEGGENKIETLQVENPVEIVLANSGITQETKKVVDDVRKEKEIRSKEFEEIFEKYMETYKQALPAIREGNWSALGKLMSRNHSFLQKMTVSCKELDEMQATALEAGAFGAKLTGTGRGGLLLALTPGKELQEKVAKALEDQGFSCLRSKIGV